MPDFENAASWDDADPPTRGVWYDAEPDTRERGAKLAGCPKIRQQLQVLRDPGSGPG